MDFWSPTLVACFLLACAVGLMASHVRTWRSADAEKLEPREREYRWRRFRRRMQTSAMLGLLAIAIFAGPLLMRWIGSKWFAFGYWTGVMLLLLWMALLAWADIIATQQHYGRLERDYLSEQTKLLSELHRIRAAKNNGRAKPLGPEHKP